MSEAWDVLTGSHTLSSEPPAAKWIARRLFLTLRSVVRAARWVSFTAWRITRWVAHTVAGTIVTAIASALISAWVTHILHLVGWLKGKMP